MIDIERFRKMPMPVQSPDEWLYFMEFIRAYFDDRGIGAPVVVEIGIQSNLQKAFYERYLGIDGEHIGIDVSDQYSKPDILGDAIALETYNALCAKLAGRKISLLFLDASQRYEDVKAYFEMYEPLVSDIIVLHPILTTTNHPDGTRRIWESIWNKQKDKWDFITIYSQVGADHPCARYQFGTGLLIRRGKP
jgi:hypothetical protein